MEQKTGHEVKPEIPKGQGNQEPVVQQPPAEEKPKVEFSPVGKKVLIFSKTLGYRHTSIAAGIVALKTLLNSMQIIISESEDSNIFTGNSMSEFDAVIFLNTSGEIFNAQEQNSFRNFLTQGKGFVGIHAATDTLYKWDWYHELVGAQCNGHPNQQVAKIDNLLLDSSLNLGVPENFSMNDEWYNFKNMKDFVTLLNLDESSYSGGAHGVEHPITWCKIHDGARSFYTGMGHRDDSYLNENFLKILKNGILFALNNDAKCGS